MSVQTHTFSVENKINSLTNQPFGSKYGGNFTVRRPSLMDDTMIALRIAAERNAFGLVNADQVPAGYALAARTVHTVHQLSETDVPAWFDRDKLFDENDQQALVAVWLEVGGFLDTFRPKSDGGGSGEES
jgi:hypothetical protein